MLMHELVVDDKFDRWSQNANPRAQSCQYVMGERNDGGHQSHSVMVAPKTHNIIQRAITRGAI